MHFKNHCGYGMKDRFKGFWSWWHKDPFKGNQNRAQMIKKKKKKFNVTIIEENVKEPYYNFLGKENAFYIWKLRSKKKMINYTT